MYFLIDHENVKSNGYKGADYLLPEDTVEIFYSECCKNISQGLFKNMKESGCEIKICKLCQTRKNALDFYIASRLGEMIGNGCQDNMAIISADQGFKSVRDYWQKRSEMKKRITLANTIADAIVSANEANNRTKMLREQLKMVSIENEFVRYEEKMRIRKFLSERFENTEFEDKLDVIEGIVEEKAGRKVLYLSSLKNFGKKNGVYIYNCIKELVG